MNRAKLKNYAWLSVAAALVTIALKSFAYWITGSVGLLSDAVESLVNLAAAIFALVILTIAARPPDDDHPYGHGKAEYFAGGVEGTLIFAAALSITYAAVRRLMVPQALEQMGLGLMICALASVVNGVVAWILLKKGREYNSITLEADAKHLLTDVWTSAAVIAGVGAVALTSWQPLDSLVALFAAANILWSGYQLVKRSVYGLMDSALPKCERDRINTVLEKYKAQGVQFHALRTHQAGARRFISVHVLVSGKLSVQQGHDIVEEIEQNLRGLFTDSTVMTHLEPNDDPLSWQDVGLDR
ncbi:MAG: cation diffusion facilitator family transporter [Elusimicrobiota bacterium]|jgi:cation diffusion facilitator family transporter